MSCYTMQVRVLCESLTGLTEPETSPQIKSVIEQARKIIFNFDYPIFDEAYRPVLETKILRHYYLREICTTPWTQWQLFLEDKMNLIMPYFNQLYESEKLAFNPLINVDYGRKTNRKEGSEESRNRNQNDTRDRTQNDNRNINTDGTTNQTVDNTNTTNLKGDTTDKHSDTPQNNLYGVIENSYLTDLKMSDTTSTQTDNGNSESTAKSNTTTKDTNELTENATSNLTENAKNTINSTEDYIESITGKNGGESYAKMLMEFRESFLNIDLTIIEELAPLFFGLYGGDY